MQQLSPYNSLPIISGLFIAILLISNVTATKIIDIGPFTFDGGTLLFPLSYIFWDILTEVYGYKNSRRIIWTAIFSMLLFAILVSFIGMMPANPEWKMQESYDSILWTTGRIIGASIIAFFAWEFANSYTLAKLKIRTEGERVPLRLIGSSIIWQGIDTTLFVIIAFYGIFSTEVLIAMIVSNYIWKLATEIIATPITVRVIAFLKKKDETDVYDRNTNFNPFQFRDE